MPKILVVETEAKIAEHYLQFTKDQGYEADVVNSNAFAAKRMDEGGVDAVLTDYSTNGKRILDTVVSNYAEIPCIIISQKASIRDSVDAIKRGAFNYLTTSDSVQDVVASIHSAIENRHYPGPKRRKSDKTHPGQFGELVGESDAMKAVFSAIGKVSNTDSTVLITGESGTGKELIARAIHFNSDRCHKPLIVINCGAIPGELLESELFGHEKGAFTGAHRTRIGRFEMADGGTIFLDEIGDMSPDLQVKLLRVLQEQSFERVGSTKPLKVDVRIIAATNKDLLKSIEKEKFREDLYYRLNVIPIHVPPLRQRKTDIPLLKEFFLKRLGGRRRYDRKRMKQFSNEAIAALMKYDWPGNIRELENMIERLSVLVEGDIIEVEDLPERIHGGNPVEKKIMPFPIENGVGFNEAVEKYQKDLILQALNQTNWVKAKAADLLKMNRTTLVEKIKKMQLESFEGTQNDEGFARTLS